MKTNKFIKSISFMLSVSVMLSSFSLGYPLVLATDTSNNGISLLAADSGDAAVMAVAAADELAVSEYLYVQRTANGEYRESVASYEDSMDLSDSLPQIYGNELGLAIDYSGTTTSLEYKADKKYNAYGGYTGYPYGDEYSNLDDNISFSYSWGNLAIEQTYVLEEASQPDLNAPELWQEIASDISVKLTARAYAGPNTNYSYTPLSIEVYRTCASTSYEYCYSASSMESISSNESCDYWMDYSLYINSGRYETQKSIYSIDVTYNDYIAPEIASVKTVNNYLYVEFTEPLRYADYDQFMANYKDQYLATITMDDGSKTTAEVVGYQDDTMMVLYVDVDKYYQANKDVTITNIDFTANYSDMYCIVSYGYNDAGELVSETVKATDGKTYAFTDYAGNGLGDFDVSLSLNTTSAIISNVSITGSMTTATNTEGLDTSNEEIDYSNLFAGEGDTFTLSMEVSAQNGDPRLMKEGDSYWYSDIGEFYALVNIIDENGEYVKVPLDYITNTETQANYNATGKLVFEAFAIEPGMYIEGGDYIKVLAVGIDNIEDGYEAVYDIYGNPITPQSVSIIPEEKIYVDGYAPEIDYLTATTADDGTILLTLQFTDYDENSNAAAPGVTSGILTKIASVYLYGDSYSGLEKSPVSFSYAVSINEEAPAASDYKSAVFSDSAETASAMEVTIAGYQSATATIYLKFDDTVENLVVENVKIYTELTDMAGNTANDTDDVSGVNIDTNPPVVSAQSIVVDYDNDSYTAIFKAQDTSLVGASAVYTVGGDTAKGVSIDAETGIITIKESFTVGEIDTKTITVVVTDKTGYTARATQSVLIDTSFAQSKYSIETDVSTPNASPVVYVSSPDAKVADGGISVASITDGDEPAASDDEPAASDDEPAASDDEPAASDDEPATSDDEPATSDDEPATSDDEPAVSDDEPVAVADDPAASGEPAAIADESTPAYTRATMTIGGVDYVRIFSSENPETNVNLFDFTGTWYAVTYNEADDGADTKQSYASVTTLTDADFEKIKATYGEVAITLETAFTDLTPAADEALEHGSDDGYLVEDLGIVKYAPAVQAYNMKNLAMVNSSGNSIIDVAALTVYNQTMAGFVYSFDVENIATFALTDIDFDQSFITLEWQADADAEAQSVSTVKLSNSASQSFTAPSMDYATGIYTVTVLITQKSGYQNTYQYTSIIVDNVTASNAKLIKTESDVLLGKTGLSVATDLGYVENDLYNSLKKATMQNADGSALTFVTVNIFSEGNSLDAFYDSDGNSYAAWNSYQSATVEDNAIMYRATTESSYGNYFTFSVDFSENSTLDGVGELKYLMLWTLNDDGTKNTYDTGNTFSGESAGIYFENADDSLGITREGIYTVYYQFIMDNGNTSDTKSFELNNASDSTTTTASLAYTVSDTVLYGGVEIPSAYDVSVVGASSSLSSVSVYHVSAAYEETVYYSGETYEYSIWKYANSYTIEEYTGAVTISSEEQVYNFLDDNNNNTASSSASGTNGVSLKDFFIVADKYGTLTFLIPYIDNESVTYSSYTPPTMEYSLFDENDYLTSFFSGLNWDIDDDDEPDNENEASIVASFDYDQYTTGKFDAAQSQVAIQSVGGTSSELMDLLGYSTNNVSGYIGAEWLGGTEWVYDYNTGTGENIYYEENSVKMTFANPIADDTHAAGTVLENKLAVYVTGKAGESLVVEGDDAYSLSGDIYQGYNYDTEVYEYTYVKLIYQDGLVNNTDATGLVTFNTYATVYGGDLSNTYQLPTDCNVVFQNIAAVDAYAVEHTFAETVISEGAPTVTSEGLDYVDNAQVADFVTLTITHNSAITVTAKDSFYDEAVTVTNNGTTSVTVTCSTNLELLITDATGTAYYYGIENIDAATLQQEIDKTITPSVEFYDVDGNLVVIADPVQAQDVATQVTAKLYYTATNGEKEYLTDADGAPVSYVFTLGGAVNYTFTSGSYQDSYGATGLDFVVALTDYGITLYTPDGTAPSVQLTVTLANSVQQAVQTMVLNLVADVVEEDHPSLPSVDSTYTKYTDAALFMKAIPAAEQYVFAYSVADANVTSVYFKEGAVTTVPADTTSDEIDGVSITIQTITVTQSATFTMFVEDALGNVTILPFEVTVPEEYPAPTYTQTLNADGSAKVTVAAPVADGITNFKVLSADVQTDADGSYYMEYVSNGVKTISYSYYYNGLYTTGTLSVTVTQIVSETLATPLELESTAYSANYYDDKTNSDVSVVYTFNKEIVGIEINATEQSALTAQGSGTRVTVSFSDNISTTTSMTCTDIDGKTYTIIVPAVTNIDKTPVEVTVTQALASIGNYTTLTFEIANGEQVSFREGGTYGASFTKKVTENGTYTYNFTDVAGNTTVLTVEVTDIVTGNLEITYCLTASGTYISDPSGLNINIGDTFYVKVNRDSTIMFNGDDVGSGTYAAGTAIEISTATTAIENYYPSILATDVYGNTAYYLFTNITPKDTEAPKIVLTTTNIYIREDATNTAAKDILLSSIMYYDNVDDEKDISVEVDFTMPATTGKTTATFTATDTAGNAETLEVSVTISSKDEAQPTVEGDVINRDQVAIVGTDAFELIVNLPEYLEALTTESYLVTYRSGIKTTAQMKNNAITIGTYSKNDEIAVTLEPGFYTFCITTQSRDYYRFVVYVA